MSVSSYPPVAGAGGGATDLPDLTDVDDLTAPTNGHFLVGDGTEWANRALLAADIPNDAVTYARMQNVSAASRLLGRGSAAGSGDVEELTLGSGLSLSGTVLSATGGSDSFVGCRAYATAATSLVNNAYTAVDMQAEDFDTHGFHSTVTNISRLTVPSGQAGYYLILGQLASIVSASGTIRVATLGKNGSFTGSSRLGENQQVDVGDGTSFPELPVAGVANLAETDYVQLGGYQDSGGNQNCNAGQGLTWLALIRLGG